MEIRSIFGDDHSVLVLDSIDAPGGVSDVEVFYGSRKRVRTLTETYDKIPFVWTVVIELVWDSGWDVPCMWTDTRGSIP